MKRFLTTVGALALTLSSLSVFAAEISDCANEGDTWYEKPVSIDSAGFQSCFVRQSGRDNEVLLVEGGLTEPTTWTRICPDVESAGGGVCREFRNRRDDRGSAAVLLVHTADYYTMSVRQFNQVPDLADCLAGDLCYRQIAVTDILPAPPAPEPPEPPTPPAPEITPPAKPDREEPGADPDTEEPVDPSPPPSAPPAPPTEPPAEPPAKPDREEPGDDQDTEEPGDPLTPPTEPPPPGPVCGPDIPVPDPSEILIGTTKRGRVDCKPITVVGTKPLEFNLHCHSVFNTPTPSGGPLFGSGTSFGIECHDGHPNDVDDTLVRRSFDY